MVPPLSLRLLFVYRLGYPPPPGRGGGRGRGRGWTGVTLQAPSWLRGRIPFPPGGGGALGLHNRSAGVGGRLSKPYNVQNSTYVKCNENNLKLFTSENQRTL